MSEGLVAGLLAHVGLECLLMQPVPPDRYARPKAHKAKESIAVWRKPLPPFMDGSAS